MADERQRLNPESKPDLQAMVDAVLPFAQQMLSQSGGFHPFGASMGPNGEVKAVAADPGGEHPAPEAVIELLEEGYRKQAAEEGLRTAAICESVTITLPGESPTHAIKISVEHQLGDSVAFYMPYSKRFLRGYQYGTIFATPKPASFLASRDAT